METEYKGYIVLAAGPPEKFKGVEYLRGEGVLAYQFSRCVKAKAGRDCHDPRRMYLDELVQDGDKRSPRPLVSRREMYRTWLSYYEPAWGIVDFRHV